jgi:para-nitrobenzyl esterase
MAGNRPERFQASDNMCKFWTSFAHYGVPSSNNLPAWKAYNLHTRPTMRIDTQCELIYNRYQKEIDMWRSINLNQF